MLSYTQYSARGSILSLNSCVRIYVCLGMQDKVTKKATGTRLKEMEIKSSVKLRRQRNVELGGKLWFPESLKWTFCTNFLLRPRSKRGMQSQMWNLFTQHGKLTCWRLTETQVGPQWKCFEAYSTEIKALSLLIAQGSFVPIACGLNWFVSYQMALLFRKMQIDIQPFIFLPLVKSRLTKKLGIPWTGCQCVRGLIQRKAGNYSHLLVKSHQLN